AREVDVLLDRERNAMQRAKRLARGDLSVRFSRDASRFLRQRLHNRVDARIDRVDAAKVRFDDLGAGEVFPGDSSGQLTVTYTPSHRRCRGTPILNSSSRRRPGRVLSKALMRGPGVKARLITAATLN